MCFGVEGGENVWFIDVLGLVVVGDVGGVYARFVVEGEDVLYGEYVCFVYVGYFSFDYVLCVVVVGDVGVCF